MTAKMLREPLEKCLLYAITDVTAKTENRKLLRIGKALLQGGVDIIQLRGKEVSDAQLMKLGASLREVTRQENKWFIVNDRPDIALLLDADGVHVGQDDLSIDEVRRFSRKWIVGKSTHSVKQAINASAEGADYIGVGPIFSTPTKPDYKEVGLRLITKVQSKVTLPWFAIGGVDEKNLNKIIESGACRVAIVRTLFCAKNPKNTAAKIKKRLTDAMSLL